MDLSQETFSEKRKIVCDRTSSYITVKTPTKSARTVNLSPRTKDSLCNICGNIITIVENKRRLFRGKSKTDICFLVETTLCIEIRGESNTNIVCRNCQRELQRIKTRLDQLRTRFGETCRKISAQCSAVQHKRMYKSGPEDEAPKKSSRKSLFGEHNQENVTPASVGEQDASAPQIISLEELCQREDASNSVSVLMKNPLLHDRVIAHLMNLISEELLTLSKKLNPSILRKTDKYSIAKLKWEDILKEWQQKAPLFLRFLQTCTSNPSQAHNRVKKDDALLPNMITAGCKLLSVFNRDLNVFQHVNSIVLLAGGAKKNVFSRLNATGDCLSYKGTINIIDKLADGWKEEMMSWKTEVEAGNTRERVLEEQLQGISHPDQPVLSTDVDATLLRAQFQKELEDHRHSMSPGYYFVGDNVDMLTKVRQITQENQNKSQHMYQMCSYKNRVSGNHLDNSSPKGSVNTVPFSRFLPDQDEINALKNEMSVLVCRTWTTYIQCMEKFRIVVPSHISHEHMKETRQKSQRINLGVLKRNEQYNEDMLDICEFLHEFVPGHSKQDENDAAHMVDKVLSGGDYLTFERHKQAQASKRDGRTQSRRLQGLVPKMEEFHNQAELLKVIWKQLYSTRSSQDVGTLYSARNLIKSHNVSKNSAGDYYACEELMEKFTAAYIITGGLHYFGMNGLEDEPSQHKYDGTIGHPVEMYTYIFNHAKSFIEEYVPLSFPAIPEYGPQSRNLVCRFCGKEYLRPMALRHHESVSHGQTDPFIAVSGVQPSKRSSKMKSKCTAIDYTRSALLLGLIRLDHNDAIKMGDGARIMRLNKCLYLLYKAHGCTKYAFGLLETLAQAEVLLTPRKAFQLIWNRTVNHQGKVDTNHPNDLDIEHCNKIFKDQAHSYRGEFTEKTIARVSRSSNVIHEITSKYDRLSNVKTGSGKHTEADTSEDVFTLVRHFLKENLYDKDSRKIHAGMDSFIMEDVNDLTDIEEFREWLSNSLEKFGRRHFYDL